MNNFEKAIAEYLGEENLKKIQAVTVGIAGAGGLGSNCAMNLVRTGFKKLVVADFDKVEQSNLNRQFYFSDQVGKMKVDALEENLKRINQDITIKKYPIHLSQNNLSEIFGSCNIIVEALDKPESKKIIVETFINSLKFIVCASGIAGIGNSDDIITRQIKPHLTIIGDLISEVTVSRSPLSPRVNIAAAKQADTILEQILKPKS
ncbi:MAG: sulfur carrier protein ThiS adenylyltransferase ThiF [Candidatus Omnitrophica bacterium]|nr:sulfur carrier protein ThiS adenylyltransferase ThiF [Candidatus Omnitrophota bacterium]